MIKKEYMKPVMLVMEAGIEQQILAVSVDAYGMNKSLQSEEEVDEAWTKRNNGSVDWDDDWSE